MKYLILFTLWTSWVKQDPSPEVWTEGGLVRGTTHKGGGYYQYLSIPYAFTDRKSRFQSAHGPPRWDGTYRAVNEHIRCPQRFSQTLVLGQENCLTLNVYTPRFMRESLPVMVYFHGGGFREGGSSPFLYGPDYLVKKDVVLVSVNYRLEILGFLCLGIKEAPGNAGLKDQVAALKWVQENIANFGGDPNDVTIFGESAGASSVAYHLLSPMSKGLFHKAIMQSGTAITPWAFQYDPLKTATLLAEQMGYKTNDPYELYKLFNSKSAEELLRTRVPREDGTVIMSETIFVPCVEQPIPGVEAFLTDYPFQIFQTGIPNKVPMIIGYNSEEGYMFAGKENDTTISSFDFFKALPRDLEFPNDIEKRRIAESAKEFYIGNMELDIVKLAKYHGEPFFKYPVLVTTEILLKTQNESVYSYRLSYDGWLNIAKFFFGFGKQPGATHADDIFYMFKTQFPSPWMFEKLMIEKITTMWTNFAKYGDPTPVVTSLLPKRWMPTRREKPVVFVIDRQFSTAPLWDTESMLFWNETYTKYRRKV